MSNKLAATYSGAQCRGACCRPGLSLGVCSHGLECAYHQRQREEDERAAREESARISAWAPWR